MVNTLSNFLNMLLKRLLLCKLFSDKLNSSANEYKSRQKQNLKGKELN